MKASYDQVQPGFIAYDRAGEKIGDIQEVDQSYLLVTKGLIFPKDIYIPFSAVTAVNQEDQSVGLNVAKDGIEQLGWDEPPIDSGTTTDTTARMAGADTGVGAANAGDVDAVRVPVVEEELSATTQRREAGQVRVGKRVVKEERDLDVPVNREQVEVRRVPADRPASGDEQAFAEGDTIHVPVMAEEVEVHRQPRVVEEVEISKRPVTETRHVRDTVRREEVDVDDAGLVGAGSGTARMSRTDLDLDEDEESETRSSDQPTNW